MNIELYINGQLADLEQKEFSYTLEAHNLFDFNTRKFSHSEVLYLPTTTNNAEIFGYADVSASSDNGAYKIYNVDYYVNGTAIVLRGNGKLMGKRGNKFLFEFTANSKEVFQAMVGKKLKDLPLDNLKHQKSLDNIQNIDNSNVVYAVADYGGETIKNIGGADYYNFDYAPPSIKMDWILQEIKKLNPQEPYVFESPFFESDFWKSLYMTVSDVKTIFDKDSLTEVFKRENWIFTGTLNGAQNNPDRYQEIGFSDDGYMRDVRNPNTRKFKVTETGKYKIDLNFKRMDLVNSVFTLEFKIWFGLKVNDKIIWEDEYYSRDAGSRATVQGKPRSIILDLNENDNVFFFVRKRTDVRSSDAMFNVWLNADAVFSINKIKNTDINEQLSDLSLIGWIKEVMKLFALTPMKDNQMNNIQQFYTLGERVNQSPVMDWSDKLIKIEEEKFFEGNGYAQVNKFKFSKYDEQNNQQDGNDFDLIFNNPTLQFQKNFESKFFLGIPYSSDVKVGGEKTDKLLFFNKEVKDKNGASEIEYKPQNNRFHIFKLAPGGLLLNSCLNNGAEKQYITPFVAESEPLRWENLIKTYYADLPRLMERMHFFRCEFNLSEMDIHSFSFYSRIYVEQLGAYFLPNKIIYKAGKPAIVEMFKIK